MKTKTLLLLGGIALLAYLYRRRQMGQIDFAVEDPTGGAYGGGGDPIYGDPLGPGVSINYQFKWAGSLHPRGFATAAIA